MIYNRFVLAAALVAGVAVGCEHHGHHDHDDHHHDHEHGHDDLAQAGDRRQLQGIENAPWWDGESPPKGRCTTPETTAEEDQKIQDIVLAWVAKKNANKGNQGQGNQGSVRGASSIFDRRLGDFPSAGILIPTVFHIIRPESSDPGPSDLVPNSMAHLNATFASAGFSFNLVDTTLTYNTEWYNAKSNEPGHSAMKSALRQGGGETLNIYASAATGTLGWSYIMTTRAGAASSTDAVIIQDQTYPGGTFNGYNEGDTLTHEVGT